MGFGVSSISYIIILLAQLDVCCGTQSTIPVNNNSSMVNVEGRLSLQAIQVISMSLPPHSNGSLSSFTLPFDYDSVFKPSLLIHTLMLSCLLPYCKVSPGAAAVHIAFQKLHLHLSIHL